MILRYLSSLNSLKRKTDLLAIERANPSKIRRARLNLQSQITITQALPPTIQKEEDVLRANPLTRFCAFLTLQNEFAGLARRRCGETIQELVLAVSSLVSATRRHLILTRKPLKLARGLDAEKRDAVRHGETQRVTCNLANRARQH